MLYQKMFIKFLFSCLIMLYFEKLLEGINEGMCLFLHPAYEKQVVRSVTRLPNMVLSSKSNYMYSWLI